MGQEANGSRRASASITATTVKASYMAKFINSLLHGTYQMAVLHASGIERMTGDRCEVKALRNDLWKIVRYDPSGKRVS